MTFDRILYNFNDRIILNDTTTEPDRYVLVGTLAPALAQPVMETTTLTIETDRPVSEGVIDFTSKISGGEVFVPLVLFGKTLGHVNELVDELKSAFNPQLVNDDQTWGKGMIMFPSGDGFMPLKWTEELGLGTRDVQVFVKPLEIPIVELDTLSGRVRTSRLRLRIEDPRKYSQTLSTMEGAGTATNNGNFRTPVKITVEQTSAFPPPPGSPSITNVTTGDTITLTSSMSEDDVLVIDTRHQTVTLNGVETRSLISTSSDWIHFAPGDNAITVSLSGDYTVTFSWYDCWSI